MGEVAFVNGPYFLGIVQICDGSGFEERVICVSGLVVGQDDKSFTERLESLLIVGGIDRLELFVVGFVDLLESGA